MTESMVSVRKEAYFRTSLKLSDKRNSLCNAYLKMSTASL